jgi:cell wall-associated NlpC family hydrolase
MIRSNAPRFSDYIGIPYGEPNDRTPGALNCWQLCEKIMIELFAINPPRYEYTGEYEKVYPVFIMELAAWERVPFPKREPGDLILLNLKGYPVHLGILVTRATMIHTLRSHGSCAENIANPRWKNRIVSVHRWPT